MRNYNYEPSSFSADGRRWKLLGFTLSDDRGKAVTARSDVTGGAGHN